jgi:AcrR family transcriptional regulator
MAKQGYHHGNLRQALIDATLTLIEAQGGVTPAAVYRHFAGREDLIAECARQGFEVFADLMEHAYNGGKPSALKAFEATGRAYLAFARKFPGHYMAMFESGLSMNRNPDLARVSDRAQGVLTRAAESLSKDIPVDRRPPAAMFAAHIWAMSHGVVELFARGAPGSRAPFPPEDLLEAGIGIYLRGLGLVPPDV